MNAELVEKSFLFKDQTPPTKTAFAAARSKISILFFIHLFLFTRKLFYRGKGSQKRWKGFYLLGVDGSAIRVPDTPQNRYLIGEHENQHGSVAACKILAVHDVLNRVFTNVFFHPRAISELSALHYNFERLADDSIFIYDRHYCDSLLMHRHLKTGKPCVIRLKSKGINAVEYFLKTGKNSAMIEFKIGERAYYSARDKYGLKNNHPRFATFQMRLIRVELQNGEIEVLATNLFDPTKYPSAEFKELYAKRWGIETAFDEIKNQLKLAVFSGYKSHIVLQDLWAVFIFYNIRAIFLSHAQKELDKEKKNCQINRNIAITIIKSHWENILLLPIKSSLLSKLINWIRRYNEKLRIRPPTKRERKHMRANERYMTEKNYKPAF